MSSHVTMTFVLSSGLTLGSGFLSFLCNGFLLKLHNLGWATFGSRRAMQVHI